MNDDFLYRVRKTPQPEFLARLKERLDQQPVSPPPPRHWSFARGLLVGSLLGGTALAVAAITFNGLHHSLPALVRAPMEFLARRFLGTREPDQSNKPDHHGAVPLGPAWLPNPTATGQTAQLETAPASLDSRHQSSGPSAATSGNSEPLSTSGAGITPSTAQTAGYDFTIVASPSTFALAKRAAGSAIALGGNRPVWPPSKLHINVELEPNGIPIERLCSTGSHRSPEVIEVSHRITPDKFRICKSYHSSIIELKIGYQAVMLARAKLYGPLKLSSRDLFLALASRLPADSHAGSLIDNTRVTWNQINSELQYEQIQVLGPDPTSGPGQIVRDLLLASGCDKDPRVAALRNRDSTHYDEICQEIRSSGAYITSGPTASWDFVDRLVDNPTAIGIFSLAQFKTAGDSLTAIPVDGIEPTAANVSNGTYPASRALYLYANVANVALSNYLFNIVVRNSMDLSDSYGSDQVTWSFVPLDDAERAATIDTAKKLKELQL
jgi:phosphate transport system substrate-binding protein